MAISDILRYLESNRSRFSREVLLGELRKAGYPEAEIQEAVRMFESGPPPPPVAATPTRSHTLRTVLIVTGSIIVIIGGLITYGFFTVRRGLDDALVKSRDARRIADTKQVQLALELYFDAEGEYPEDLSLLQGQFILVVPTDPLSGLTYAYHRCDKMSYHFGADLEAADNAALASDDDVSSFCPGDTVSGFDSGGCRSKISETPDRACYDVTERAPTYGNSPSDQFDDGAF